MNQNLLVPIAIFAVTSGPLLASLILMLMNYGSIKPLDAISSAATLAAGAFALIGAASTIWQMSRQHQQQMEELTKKNNIDIFFKFKEEEVKNIINNTLKYRDDINKEFTAEATESNVLYTQTHYEKPENGRPELNLIKIEKHITKIEQIDNEIYSIIDNQDEDIVLESLSHIHELMILLSNSIRINISKDLESKPRIRVNISTENTYAEDYEIPNYDLIALTKRLIIILEILDSTIRNGFTPFDKLEKYTNKIWLTKVHLHGNQSLIHEKNIQNKILRIFQSKQIKEKYSLSH